MLKLLGYCVAVKTCRQHIIAENKTWKGIPTLIYGLRVSLKVKPFSSSMTMVLVNIIDSLLGDICSNPKTDYDDLAKSKHFGTVDDLSDMLKCLSPVGEQASDGKVGQNLLKLLPRIATGSEEKCQVIVDYYKPAFDFAEYDRLRERNGDQALYLDSMLVLVEGMQAGPLVDRFKDHMVRCEMLKKAVEYLETVTPVLMNKSPGTADFESVITNPALK